MSEINSMDELVDFIKAMNIQNTTGGETPVEMYIQGVLDAVTEIIEGGVLGL